VPLYHQARCTTFGWSSPGRKSRAEGAPSFATRWRCPPPIPWSPKGKRFDQVFVLPAASCLLPLAPLYSCLLPLAPLYSCLLPLAPLYSCLLPRAPLYSCLLPRALFARRYVAAPPGSRRRQYWSGQRRTAHCAGARVEAGPWRVRKRTMSPPPSALGPAYLRSSGPEHAGERECVARGIIALQPSCQQVLLSWALAALTFVVLADCLAQLGLNNLAQLAIQCSKLIVVADGRLAHHRVVL
jgi:hypothetical protein